MLQLGELGARQRDAPLMRAEVHDHGVVFHAEDDAEPVLVVRHLIVDGERLDRARWSRGVERAAGQVAPGRAAGCLHSYHHAPSHARPAGPAAEVGSMASSGCCALRELHRQRLSISLSKLPLSFQPAGATDAQNWMSVLIMQAQAAPTRAANIRLGLGDGTLHLTPRDQASS